MDLAFHLQCLKSVCYCCGKRDKRNLRKLKSNKNHTRWKEVDPNRREGLQLIPKPPDTLFCHMCRIHLFVPLSKASREEAISERVNAIKSAFHRYDFHSDENCFICTQFIDEVQELPHLGAGGDNQGPPPSPQGAGAQEPHLLHQVGHNVEGDLDQLDVHDDNGQDDQEVDHHQQQVEVHMHQENALAFQEQEEDDFALELSESDEDIFNLVQIR